MDQHENQGGEENEEKKKKERVISAKPEVCWPYMPLINGRAAESIQTPSQKSQFGILGVPHALCKHSEIIISS